MNTSNTLKWLFGICFAVIFWTALFLLLGRFWGVRDLWAIMLIGSTVITFFATLAFPGNVDENGIIRESRIRLAVMSALLITYLVYFGSVVYLDAADVRVETFAKEMLPTLTHLLTVTISFYFGSTAAIEILNRRAKKDESREEG